MLRDELGPTSGAARAARRNRFVLMLFGLLACTMGALFFISELFWPTRPGRNSAVPVAILFLLLGGLLFLVRHFLRAPQLVSDDLRHFLHLRAERVSAALAKHREVPVHTRTLREVRIIARMATLPILGFFALLECGPQASHLPGTPWLRLPLESLLLVLLYELCFRIWRGDALLLNASQLRVDKPGGAAVALTALQDVAVREVLLSVHSTVASCTITFTLLDQKGQSLAVTGDFPVYVPRGRAILPKTPELDGADPGQLAVATQIPGTGRRRRISLLTGRMPERERAAANLITLEGTR